MFVLVFYSCLSILSFGEIKERNRDGSLLLCLIPGWAWSTVAVTVELKVLLLFQHLYNVEVQCLIVCMSENEKKVLTNNITVLRFIMSDLHV